MLEVKYFAYGSNLDINRLKNRVERHNQPVEVYSNYTLNNYELVFNVGSTWNSFANIVPRQGARVEGVLYNLSSEQFKILDFYEGYYKREFFHVTPNILACTYTGLNEAINYDPSAKPLLSYLNIILEAANSLGFNETVIKLLNYKKANYKLKKGTKKLKNYAN